MVGRGSFQGWARGTCSRSGDSGTVDGDSVFMCGVWRKKGGVHAFGQLRVSCPHFCILSSSAHRLLQFLSLTRDDLLCSEWQSTKDHADGQSAETKYMWNSEP